METQKGIISVLRARTSTYRLYWAKRLYLVTTGMVRRNGIWVMKSRSTDLPILDVRLPERPIPVSEESAVRAAHVRNGAWIGTAILLLSDTIPRP
jgi:hypothetical protein